MTRAGLVGALPEFQARLSPKEREIMLLASKGLLKREIASVTGMNFYTVRSHFRRALARLNASNTAEAVAIAIREGLI